MSFDAFRFYLTSAHRSPTTGRPFSPHAAGDYPSRLRRLEALLGTSLQDAPPVAPDALAANLRRDPRVTAAVPLKVIGDLAVALRTYAAFLDALNAADAATVRQPVSRDDIVTKLLGQRFGQRPTRAESIIELRRDDLTVYARTDARQALIVHPATEALYSEITAVNDLIFSPRVRFFHHQALVRFPRRDNGSGLIHYGIPFGAATESALLRLIETLAAAERPSGQAMTRVPEFTVTETESDILATARRGQGRFRADLLNFWRGQCAVTDVSMPESLRASQIKPWQHSTDRERLDVFNGLLLAVHLDALFDRSLVSFGESGELLVSKRVSGKERAVFGLIALNRKILVSAGHLEYLHHHRTRFLRSEANPAPATPPAPAGAACVPPTA
jgi:hypothetical protein